MPWTSDPILGKDLGDLARRPRTYLGRGFYVALMGAVLYSTFEGSGSFRRAWTTSDYAEIGREIFQLTVALQMVVVPVAAAVAAADLMQREIRAGTLPLLLLSGLDAWGIVAGKWKAVLLSSILLSLCGVPVQAAAAFLGAVGPLDLAWSLSLSMALSAHFAASALFMVIVSRSSVRAVVVSFILPILWAVPTVLLLAVGEAGPQIAACLHPYAAYAAAAHPGFGWSSEWGWIGASLVTLGLTRRFLLAAAGHLRISATVSALVHPSSGPAPLESRPPPRDPGPVDDARPLLWKELAVGRPRYPSGARFLVGLFAGILSVVFLTSGDGAQLQTGLFGAAFTLYLAAAGAGLFVREKAGHRFDILLSTPVRPVDVVGAKLLAGLLTPESVLLGLPVGIGVALSADPGRTGVVWTVFPLFVYVLAANLSLRVRTFPAALFPAVSVAVGLVMGSSVLQSFSSGPGPGPGNAWLSALNPYEAADAGSGSTAAFAAVYGSASLALAVDLVAGLRSRATSG